MRKKHVTALAILLFISVLNLVGQNETKAKNQVKIHTLSKEGEVIHKGVFVTSSAPHLNADNIENLTYVVYAGAGGEIPYSIQLIKGLTTVELYFSSPAYMNETTLNGYCDKISIKLEDFKPHKTIEGAYGYYDESINLHLVYDPGLKRISIVSFPINVCKGN